MAAHAPRRQNSFASRCREITVYRILTRQQVEKSQSAIVPLQLALSSTEPDYYKSVNTFDVALLIGTSSRLFLALFRYRFRWQRLFADISLFLHTILAEVV